MHAHGMILCIGIDDRIIDRGMGDIHCIFREFHSISGMSDPRGSSYMDGSGMMRGMSDPWRYEPPGIIIRYVRFTPVRTLVGDRRSSFPKSPYHV